MTAPTSYSVNDLDVVLALLRAGLPGTRVMSRLPDPIVAHLPLVVVRRTGGSSFAPRFYDEPFVNVANWAASSPTVDASRAAWGTADAARRVLWQAWDEQTVTPHGHIAWLRESQAPLEEPDPDLPHHARFIATYELKVRRPRVT